MINNSIFRWERDFSKTVVRLAVPIMIQALVMALMHILDNMMIGQLGEVELAGVTQANRVTFLLQIILFGLVSGTSIFSAQYWGKRDVKGIRNMMGLSLITALALALAFAIPSMIIPEKLMGLLINDAEAARKGAEYLRIVALVYLLDAVMMVHEAVLKSTERVNLPTIAGIVAILTNTLFNYLLIFGKFGFPKLGVQGGALATLLGVSLQMGIMLGVSYKRKYPNAIKLREIRLPQRDIVKKYYRTVAPVLLNEALWSLGVVMYSVAYGRMGPGAVAAMSIFSNVEQLSFVVLRGVNGACCILVGKAIGAGYLDEAQRNAKRFLAYTVLAGVLIGVLVIAFAGNIVSLFNVSEQTAEAAKKIINFYGYFIWLSAGNGTLIVGILRSGGDVIYSAFLDTIFLWCVSVPLVFIFGPYVGLPIHYVYLFTKADELLKLSFGLLRIKSRKWINNLVE